MCLYRKPEPLDPEAVSHQPEDPCQELASEARDAWVDAPYEVHCIRYDRATGKMLTLVASSEDEAREFFNPEP